MCGVFGWFGRDTDLDAGDVGRLQRLLRHRGPDDVGYESGPGWGLGFRRLSILDLSPLGHQPMCSPDGRFWIIFNGEIYNYVELRDALEREGERFASTSDTEVLARLLARDGVDALDRLNGMFALAMVDTQRRTFLLARDRLGVKPLYYQLLPGRLRFASELKGLLGWRDATREVDPAAVVEYLALGYLPHETSIFRGYAKLPPGHALTGSLDAPERARPARYWRLAINDDPGGEALRADQLDELEALLADATRIRLRSDVPVGIFLSGGLDSGIVATLAGRSGMRTPLALTVSFAEEAYDEHALAGATAASAGLDHRAIAQTPAHLSDVDRLAWYFDEPFGDPSALPTFALCEAASRHATVFLSGDGGDEAFGGYRRYVEAVRYGRLAALPDPLLVLPRMLSRAMPPLSGARYRLHKGSLPDAGFAAAFDGPPEDPAVAFVLHPELRPLARHAGRHLWTHWASSRGRGLLARQQQLDYDLYLPDDILVKVDRASMAHSIEVRSPFLDYRVVEWAARLPRGALLSERAGKQPLRALGATLLPGSVASGAKRGFGIPLRDWFRHADGQRLARARLLGDDARRRGLWDVARVARVLDAHASRDGRDFGPLLWRLLVLEAWARWYLDARELAMEPPLLVDARVPAGLTSAR